MSNKIKFFYTSSQRLPLLPVVDGQMIFTIDTNIIYLDINGLRLSYNTIKIFDTEDERQNASSLAEGFYFVNETNIAWKYKGNGSWTQLTPSNLEPIFIGSYDTFPSIGQPKTLYVADEGIYKWDEYSNKYLMVSNKTEWQKIGE